MRSRIIVSPAAKRNVTIDRCPLTKSSEIRSFPKSPGPIRGLVRFQGNTGKRSEGGNVILSQSAEIDLRVREKSNLEALRAINEAFMTWGYLHGTNSVRLNCRRL